MKGPIDCRVRQTTDGEWIAVARRGSGQEGDTASVTAPGPAEAAQAAIAALLAAERVYPNRSSAAHRASRPWTSDDAVVDKILEAP